MFNPKIGDLIYIINRTKPIIYFYDICNIQEGKPPYQKRTVQYNINLNGEKQINVYTVGKNSGQIGERFQIDEIKAVLSLFKIHSCNISNLGNMTKQFCERVINEHPEYFI